jgi:hypothetical protein
MGKSNIGSIGSDVVANNFGKLDHFITVKIIFMNQKGSSLMDQDEFVESCFNHFLKLDLFHETLLRGAKTVKLFFRLMEQHALKSVNNSLNTNIYSFLEASGGQSSNHCCSISRNQCKLDICGSLRPSFSCIGV